MIRTLAILLCTLSLTAACESTPKTEDKAPAEAAAPAEEPAEVAPTAAEGLDGRTFAVKITDAAGKVTEDTLSFTDGKFNSTDCEQYGFTAGKYEVSDAAGLTEFSAESSSEKEGKMTWKGTVNGGKITGKYEWVKEGQDPATAMFEGTAN